MRYALAAIALILSAGAAPAGPCLTYTDPVRLTGKVRYQVFPGPPSFESVARGDKPERAAILILDKPMCVAADPTDDSGLSPAVASVRKVQLVVDGKLPPSAERRLVVSGKLFHSDNGHHRTEVLLDQIKF